MVPVCTRFTIQGHSNNRTKLETRVLDKRISEHYEYNKRGLTTLCAAFSSFLFSGTGPNWRHCPVGSRGLFLGVRILDEISPGNIIRVLHWTKQLFLLRQNHSVARNSRRDAHNRLLKHFHLNAQERVQVLKYLLLTGIKTRGTRDIGNSNKIAEPTRSTRILNLPRECDGLRCEGDGGRY